MNIEAPIKGTGTEKGQDEKDVASGQKEGDIDRLVDGDLDL